MDSSWSTRIAALGFCVLLVVMVGWLVQREPSNPINSTAVPDLETFNGDQREWFIERMLWSPDFLNPERIVNAYRTGWLLLAGLIVLSICLAPIFKFTLSPLRIGMLFLAPIFWGNGLIPYLIFFGILDRIAQRSQA